MAAILITAHNWITLAWRAGGLGRSASAILLRIPAGCSTPWQSIFSVAAGVCSAGLAGLQRRSGRHPHPVGDYFGELTFIPDGLGVFLAAIATVIGCLAVIFSIDYMHGDSQIGRYYFLVLFFIGAMAGLVLTGSLLFLFVFWEITALCSYALISFYNDDPKAVAGGIKALIITQVGGVGLLVGALVAYAQTGQLPDPRFPGQAAMFPPALLGLIGVRLPDRQPRRNRRRCRSTPGCRMRWKRRPRSAR